MLAFIGLPGGAEWIIILIIALLIFGKRLPEVMRSMGHSIKQFKKGLEDADIGEDAATTDRQKEPGDGAGAPDDAAAGPDESADPP